MLQQQNQSIELLRGQLDKYVYKLGKRKDTFHQMETKLSKYHDLRSMISSSMSEASLNITSLSVRNQEQKQQIERVKASIKNE